MKEQKERETRQHAEELLKYLEFDDIKDFRKLTTQDFEEINFFTKDQVSENVTENESSCDEQEFVIQEAIASKTKGCLTETCVKEELKA